MHRSCTLFFCSLVASGLAAQANFEELSQGAGLAGTLGPNHCLAVGDYDGDGKDDLFLGRIGAANQLFRNQGDGTFQEVAVTAGVAGAPTDHTYAAVWGDLDNDGDQDLYVGNRNAPDQLFENLGNGTFRDVATIAGIDNLGAPRSVNLADVNNDGWTDIFVANFRQPNRLYRNLGQLRFVEEAAARGVTDELVSMGAIFTDYDRDGDADLYLTHDNRQPNLLLNNDGNGFFTDAAKASGADYAGFGMGVATGDVDNDGWPDLYITNLYANALLRNNGDGTFADWTFQAGVGDEGMGWGTTFLDVDNDGREDLYVVNESYFSPYPNVLYRNLGNDTFAVVTNPSVEGSPFGGYAAATMDVDRDGRIDLFVANSGQTGGLQYFHNVTSGSHHWLSVRLMGTLSNRDAIGAKIVLTTDHLTNYREVTAGSGYSAQNSYWQHFGLGQDTLIQRLAVTWPSGITEEWEQLPVNQSLTILEGGKVLATEQTKESTSFNVLLFPNPTADNLTVRLSPPPTAEITVQLFAGNGQTMHEQRLVPAHQDLRIDLGQLPAGAYLLSISGYPGQWVIRRD